MATVRIIELTAVQAPFSIGPDANNRATYSCNYGIPYTGDLGVLDEIIASIIHNDSPSLGTLNTDLFLGSYADIPTGSGPYTLILETSGFSPSETHTGDKIQNSTLQILVYAKSTVAARVRAFAIFERLDGIRRRTVTV